MAEHLKLGNEGRLLTSGNLLQAVAVMLTNRAPLNMIRTSVLKVFNTVKIVYAYIVLITFRWIFFSH